MPGRGLQLDEAGAGYGFDTLVLGACAVNAYRKTGLKIRLYEKTGWKYRVGAYAASPVQSSN